MDSSLSHEIDVKVKSTWAQIRRKWAGIGNAFLLGDCMALLKAVTAFESLNGSTECCLKLGLRFKAMTEIRKLRKQLTGEINLLVGGSKEAVLNPKMKAPTGPEANLLRQIILSGLPDRVAKKIPEDEIKDGENKKLYKYAYRFANSQNKSKQKRQNYTKKSQLFCNYFYISDVEN